MRKPHGCIVAFGPGRDAARIQGMLGACLAICLAVSSPSPQDLGFHRAPFKPGALARLPLGAIKPRGWLKRVLELQAEGFSGRLSEISKFLDPKDNAWLSSEGQGVHGWEEVPYWLRGQYELGVLLDDERIKSESRRWTEAILKNQGEDGWIGPRANQKASGGYPDMWSVMPVLDVFKNHFDATGDKRVLDVMTKYFHGIAKLPDKAFLEKSSYWQYLRAPDQFASILWLYDRTGDASLIELARRTQRLGAQWTKGELIDKHGVNFAQGMKGPAVYGLLEADYDLSKRTAKLWNSMADPYGQFPGGLYGADENVREGYIDPRQAAETCAAAEMLFSLGEIVSATGDPHWGDHSENIAFNTLPAMTTADLKALRYLTSANLVRSDRPSKSPGVQNGGPMFCMDPNDHRCCQHNFAFGWPSFVRDLWMVTPDGGLAATAYGPSEVLANLPSGKVRIVEETDYPFEPTIRLSIHPEKNAKFPLRLRIPAWTEGGVIRVNGQVVEFQGRTPNLEREWKAGDRVEIDLPMALRATTWKSQKGAMSYQYGPLGLSLAIQETYRRSGGTDAWPAWDILPGSPWNFGLADRPDFDVRIGKLPDKGNPFDPKNNPLHVFATGRAIPEWQEDYTTLVGKLQASPALTEQPESRLELIPMGAARLRISVFPTVTTDARVGHRWVAPQKPQPSLPASASHVHGGDTLSALSDGLEPKSSNDQDIPRFTWWDHRGTTEWVGFDYQTPQNLQSVEVYWFDDTAEGKCRVPESWRIKVLVDGEWKEVDARDPFGVEKDQYNRVRFAPVHAMAIRIEAKLRPGFSAGILELRAR